MQICLYKNIRSKLFKYDSRIHILDFDGNVLAKLEGVKSYNLSRCYQ